MHRAHAVERPPRPRARPVLARLLQPPAGHTSPGQALRAFSRAAPRPGRAAGRGRAMQRAFAGRRCRPGTAAANPAGHTSPGQALRAFSRAAPRPGRAAGRAAPAPGRQANAQGARCCAVCPAAAVPAPATPGAARARAGRCACMRLRSSHQAAGVPAPATPGAARARAAGRGRRTPSHS